MDIYFVLFALICFLAIGKGFFMYLFLMEMTVDDIRSDLEYGLARRQIYKSAISKYVALGTILLAITITARMLI